MRALLQRLRARDDQRGYTLVEVIATVVILGIIMVPLGTAMVVGYRTVFGIQERLANSADVQLLSTYFPSDVASVDADGVNPDRIEDEGICKASADEESLITFRWDKDLGAGGQTVVRYLARWEGLESELVRRVCRGSDPAVETVLARHFGELDGPDAADYLTPEGAALPTPTCGTRQCYIEIDGAYDFRLDARRRVEGDVGGNRPPQAPTNVHALGGFERARLFWDDPLDTGGTPITGYYVEQNPGGIVGGTTPTMYLPGTGTSGALIDGLTNNQSYTFKVRAVTAVGNGPWSESSNAVTPGPTTPEPPSLDAAAGDPAVDGRVNAEWSLPSDYSNGGAALTGFTLTALNPDAIPTVVTESNPATFSGALTDLDDNTKYKVQVSALNSYGEGSPSPIPMTALTRPGQPGTPTAGATETAGSVTLTFTLPEGGDLTDLTNVRAKVGSTFQDPVDVPTACPELTSCTITASGIDVSSSTNVRVQVRNATGWGAESDVIVIPADNTPPTVGIAFPENPQYGAAAWEAGCDDSGGAICGTAADAFPGAVASVTLTVRRSGDNRYWNGSPGTSTTQWPSTSVTGATTLTATGTSDWSRALTTASLENRTYTIAVTARDTLNQASTTITRQFTYVAGAPTAALTAPANGADVGGAVTVAGNAGATSPATVTSAQFEYKRTTDSDWIVIDTDTSSPYSVSWDASALVEGSYQLRMITTDSAGSSTTSSTRTVTVDNTAPTGSVTAPAAGAWLRGTVAVSSNSADPGSGVANAQFQYKPTAGSTWTNIGSPDTSSPYGVSWNTLPLADGSYDLRVITTDRAGFQTTSSAITAQVDNTNPVIGAPTVIGSSGTNGWYTSDVSVTWPAPTDAGSGISSTTGCGPTNLTANTSGQVVTCSATDNAGNTASQSVTIKIDKTAPTGSVQLPASGATVAGSVNVTSNSADSGSGVADATFQVSPAGASTWSQIGSPDPSSPYSVSWNTSSLAQGSYDLRVITTDNAGNSFTSPVRTVFVDSTPPTVAITFPADDGAYNTTTYNAGCPTNQICGTAADTAPGSVASVSVTIRRSSDSRYWNGTAGTSTSQWSTSATNLTVSGTTSWNRVFATSPTTSLQNGVTYTVVVTATDQVGLTGTDTHTFLYDTTDPSGSITAPANNANVSGTTTITSNSADSGGAGVASAVFEYRVGTSGAWTLIGTDVAGPTWSVAWNTVPVPDNQYYLRVTTTDNAGNSVSSGDTSVRVRVDTTAPTGSVQLPASGATVAGSVNVTSNSADSGSGVADATFQVSPAGASTWSQIGSPDPSSPYSVSWNTSSLAQGSYDLRVITTDNAGNSFTSPVRTVFVDSTPPTVAITFPADDGAYNTTTYNAGCPTNQICGTAADTAPGSVASVSVTIRRSSDSRYWNGTAGTSTSQWSTSATNLTVSGTTSWNRVFATSPTTSLQNGVTYTVVVTATDQVGLTGTDTHTFLYDTTDPSGSITAPANNANVSGTTTITSNSADSGGAGVASAVFEYRVGTSGAWTLIGTDVAGPTWSVAWNTVPVPDNQYYLRVTTTDNAGNSVSSGDTSVRVRVDTTAPTGQLTGPAAGAFVSGTVGVFANSADSGSGVANATFQRSPAGANNWTTIGSPDTSNPYSVNWVTTSGTPNGSYDLRVVTTDNAGNSFTSATRTVTVDNTAPTAVANATGTVVNGWYTTNVGVTWTVSDSGSGIASQTGCGNQNVTSDTTGVTFTCVVTDNAGNTTNASTTIKRDTVNPTGSLTAPDDGAFVTGTIAVSSNSADATSGVEDAEFQRRPAGGGTWTTIGTDTSSPYSVNWNTASQSEGAYDLRVITTDNVGRTFTSPTRTVTVDRTKPAPTSVSLSGTNGASGNGQAGAGDQVRIVYSEPLDLSTLCSSWSGTGNQSTSMTITLANAGGGSNTSDEVRFPSTCSATDIGVVDTNRDYVSTTRTFSSSTVAWNAASRTLTITLGTPSGSTNTGQSNTAPTYTPTTSIADLAGNTMNATGFNGTSSRF